MTEDSIKEVSDAEAGSNNGASNKSTTSKTDITLDWVLIHELGQFGRFQLTNFLLIAIPISMTAFMSEFIFSAAAIPHRCQIPECGETTASHDYMPEWIYNAVPERGGSPVSCDRYVATSNGSLSHCPVDIFDKTAIQGCEGYVYERNDSVVYEFDLGCQEWLRALAGTLNSLGTLLVLPITGYVSDKYGRRTALIISVFNIGVFGLIRAFSVNYPMYLAFQLLQTTFGAGALSAAYIFAGELVGPKYRVVITASCSSMFAVGHVVLGAMAWLVGSWRHLLMVLNIPCFIIVVYYWLQTESVRWLLSKQKFPEAKAVLQKVARINKKKISEKSMEALLTPSVQNCQTPSKDLIRTIWRSPVLRRRVFTTPVWWITAAFVYYGLSINSVGLAGNMYANYMLISAIEIPGFYSAVLLLDRVGRKATISGGFFLSAVCCIVFAFINTNEMETFGLILFLIGKFGISTVFTSLYLFTSELYPTQHRHTLLAFSSMIGRVGSITAPLTPVLMQYWRGIPSLMFGAMGLLSGCLVLTQPETYGTKMPDTLAEAEGIGRPVKTKG
ncbi:solute carrier family 22 member 7-like [Choristoneura fumiferana]|uniref:solute carrier family 22 member 7-like n=1 Tax=Choristoneura fumiferana TaxID=7141 RepID=UPI003D157233